MTLFTKIIKREIPAEIVFEDDQCIAFKDIAPQAPVHVLLVPKKEIPSLEHLQPADETLLGSLLVKASLIAKKLGIAETGYRVVINTGKNGQQTVPHIHLHILGGRVLKWPPG